MPHLSVGTPSESGQVPLQSQDNQRSYGKTGEERSFLAGRLGGALSAAALLLMAAWGGYTVNAQTLVSGWDPLSPATNPPERYIHAMTYDAGQGKVVLFGGFGQVSRFTQSVDGHAGRSVQSAPQGHRLPASRRVDPV